MSSLLPIIFYDIPGTVEGIAWSPNTWKTRYALNYKGLPYKTEWVEYPDIASVCQKIGAAPTGTNAHGAPLYTLPAIHDPNTITSVSDSALIARYLDKTYPATPVLIPPETDALHAAFEEAIVPTILMPMMPLVILPTHDVLNLKSAEFFRRTREAMFGKPMEELASAGPARDAVWRNVESGFAKVAEWLSVDGREKVFFMGDQISHADLHIAGFLIWMKKVFGADSKEWAIVTAWDGGRWASFLKSLEKYEVTAL